MRRRVLLPVLALAAVLLPVVRAPVAVAAVTAEVHAGVLEVTGDADGDVLVISCSGGDVVVNGQDPSTGAFPCADLSGMDVATGAGNDRILLDEVTPSEFSGLGSLVVDAGADWDYVAGSPGDDELRGGLDDDTLLSGGGDDAIDGGDGDDELEVSGTKGCTLTNGKLVDGDSTLTLSSIEEVHISTAARSVVIDAERYRGRTFVVTGDGPDRIVLGRGNDIVSSGGGGDRIFGGAGLDSLVGGDGRDVIRGQSGNDDLVGGAGRDRCVGGPGGDRFAGCERIDHVP
jgi:Ca2+-binding RTX toxin-like protein